jgi:hypothetical protein
MPSNQKYTANNQQPEQPTPAARRFQCRHIRANGLRCGMVSLRGESLCYYHHTNRRPSPRSTRDQLGAIIPVPLIEDRSSIQLAISDIVARIAANTIDTRRAGLILYGLQIASHNLPREPRFRPKSGRSDQEDVDLLAVEDLTLDPDLGPLAPVNEVISPEVKETSLRQRFMDFMNSPDRVCQRCEERDRLDANRAEAARLILEREKEDPNDPEIHRLAERVRATLPDIQASAEPATNPAAPSSPRSVAHSLRNCHPERSEGPASRTSNLEPRTRAPHPSRRTSLPLTPDHLPLLLPTLHAVADEVPPTKRRCRITRAPIACPEPRRRVSILRRGRSSRALEAGQLQTAKPAVTPEPTPNPTESADLARRTTRLARAFRHRFYPQDIPTPLQRAKS